MVHACAAIARPAAVIRWRCVAGLIRSLRGAVIHGRWSGRFGPVAGGYCLCCCLHRSHVRQIAGVAQVLQMHGRARDARTVGQKRNDQEQPHQERTQSHAPDYTSACKRGMNAAIPGECSSQLSTEAV